jgi:hypothetical protein
VLLTSFLTFEKIHILSLRFFFAVLGMELVASCILGVCSTTELHSQPKMRHLNPDKNYKGFSLSRPQTIIDTSCFYG